MDATIVPSRPPIRRERGWLAHISVYVFVIVPFAALCAVVPVAWGWGLSWLDAVLSVLWYSLTFLGITVGYHRYFTHGAFKAGRGVRMLLAVAGSMAVHGPVINWVADHRRHHAFSDREGDPHSPWLFGVSPMAVIHGMWHSHVGWILDRERTNHERFAPDLRRDRDIRVIHSLFVPLTAVTLGLPSLIGWLVTGSLHGALTALFWAGFVRVALVHHVSWSVNSVCHMVGARPFRARDRSANVWPLAILSMGEAWHNFHHADPTCARHGVMPGQIDISARVIWSMERLGLVHEVRWPDARRLERLTAS